MVLSCFIQVSVLVRLVIFLGGFWTRLLWYEMGMSCGFIWAGNYLKTPLDSL